MKKDFDEVLSRGRHFCHPVEIAGASGKLFQTGIDLPRHLIDDILLSVFMPKWFITFSTEEAVFSSLER